MPDAGVMGWAIQPSLRIVVRNYFDFGFFLSSWAKYH